VTTTDTRDRTEPARTSPISPFQPSRLTAARVTAAFILLAVLGFGFFFMLGYLL